MRAARRGDHIGHTSALGGLITGAAVGGVVGVLGVAAGAALAAGVGILAVFTAPVSIPLLIGGALVGAAAGAGIGEFVGSLSFISSITGNGFSGEIASGSPDVYINSREAARVAIDTAPCVKDPPVVALIAIGSSNVFINDHRAARRDDKVSCGAIIKEGSENVYIGGEQEKVMDVEEDVPGWVHALVFGAGIAGALLIGGPAVIPTMIYAGGLGMIGSDLLGRLGRNYGGLLSERYGGLPSDWENSGRFFGGGIGGWLGTKGAKLAQLLKFDPNTLFSIGGVPPLPPSRPRRALRKGYVARTRPRRGPRHGEAGRISKAVELPGGLRNVAKEVHRLIRGKPPNERAIEGTAVAIVRVKLPNGTTTYYASGSQGKLTPIQAYLLKKAGVPRENLLTGAQVRTPRPRREHFSSEEKYKAEYESWKKENHGERVILRNLPEGSKVEEWGISYGSNQSPHPCSTCKPFVDRSGGKVQGVEQE
jgi:uncharacterized Zn-binding protein involved in type VI secretion